MSDGPCETPMADHVARFWKDMNQVDAEALVRGVTWSAVYPGYVAAAICTDYAALAQERDEANTVIRGMEMAYQAAVAERDRLAAENGELCSALDGLMSELQDTIEAEMGRELRSRDLPRSWHRAARALDKAKKEGGTDANDAQA